MENKKYIKHSTLKDLKKRKIYYKKTEQGEDQILRALIRNKILPLGIRQEIGEIIEKKGSKGTRIRNVCRESGRTRAILKEWGLSRLEFRRLADNGKIAGIRKSSW